MEKEASVTITIFDSEAKKAYTSHSREKREREKKVNSKRFEMLTVKPPKPK